MYRDKPFNTETRIARTEAITIWNKYKNNENIDALLSDYEEKYGQISRYDLTGALNDSECIRSLAYFVESCGLLYDGEAIGREMHEKGYKSNDIESIWDYGDFFDAEVQEIRDTMYLIELDERDGIA